MGAMMILSTTVGMADQDISRQLEDLHRLVIEKVAERVEGFVDPDGRLVPPSADDLRVALQLLKQNSISVAAVPANPAAAASRLAGKLTFDVLERQIRARATLSAGSGPELPTVLPQAARQTAE